MQTPVDDSTTVGQNTIPQATAAELAADGPITKPEGTAEEEWFEPDAHEHFRSISGYPGAVAKMLVLCASELGASPYQTVKIARRGATHGDYADCDLARDAELVLAESQPPAPANGPGGELDLGP